MPEISGIEIFKVNIPFRVSFKHALKERRVSESIFIKVALGNGVCGYGESLPRSYVTGNTQDSVFKKLKEYAPSLKGYNLKEGGEGLNFIRALDKIEGEARCALEIALLDCLGKISNKPIHAILGNAFNKAFDYSGVISGDSLFKTGIVALYFASNGYKFIKIKVGGNNDAARVGLVRCILRKSDIRIDANGAWNVKGALEAIHRLKQFNISCIEQPVPKGDIEAMRAVALSCPEPIIADESLCTRADASKLAEVRACDMFNIRLSKCGGILRSMEIMKIADAHGLSYQIGCHVGESGILSAAARHLATVSKKVKYMEGSYSRILLKEDIIEEDITPKRGVGLTLDGPGLGVTVIEDRLRKYTTESST